MKGSSFTVVIIACCMIFCGCRTLSDGNGSGDQKTESQNTNDDLYFESLVGIWESAPFEGKRLPEWTTVTKCVLRVYGIDKKAYPNSGVHGACAELVVQREDGSQDIATDTIPVRVDREQFCFGPPYSPLIFDYAINRRTMTFLDSGGFQQTIVFTKTADSPDKLFRPEWLVHQNFNPFEPSDE